MNLYMHTLDGKPAGFDPRHDYMYFARGRQRFDHMFCSSLRDLRREQERAIAADLREGRDADARYGYVLVAGAPDPQPEQEEGRS